MQKRPLGPGAPKVSEIGFGGMPLSIQGRPSDEREAIRVIHALLDAGTTLIDTANVYCLDDDDIGHNERLVAKAVPPTSTASTTTTSATTSDWWPRQSPPGPAGWASRL
jgi:aryl-alcohol dehydrogenase-like predicted oxidoreductase